MLDRRPVRRVEFDPPGEPPLDLGRWPWTLPVVRQVRIGGLDLAPVTVLVGENGSGKSTLLEGVALAYGFSPEGGSTGARHTTRVSESELFQALHLTRGAGAPKDGFFLRAETMHGFFSYLEANPEPRSLDPVFHELSHGESVLALLQRRFQRPGFYCLDEPESALSFSGCLALVGALTAIADDGGQVLVATHSPIIAALPRARILEAGEWGLREVAWDELDLVRNWQAFLAGPDRYLRHVT